MTKELEYTTKNGINYDIDGEEVEVEQCRACSGHFDGCDSDTFVCGDNLCIDCKAEEEAYVSSLTLNTIEGSSLTYWA